MNIPLLEPQWPAPPCIKAYTTLRVGGVSQPPFDQFNLAEHVGDQLSDVQLNRDLLKKQLNLPTEPIWLQQIHSTTVVKALPENRNSTADASFTDQINQACVVLTADCLPLLICHRKGTHIAAIHAGWRGLLNGIIEATLQSLPCHPEELMVWLGPAISAPRYEVGDEMRNLFLQQHPEAEYAFILSDTQRWHADLYALARLRLLKQGITAIYGGNLCTYSDPSRFYSYRRDSGKTGRMATIIWISQ